MAQVYTAGLLPRPHPYLVYEYATLGALARTLPTDVDILAVNVATPCEQYFPTDAEEREVWLDLHHGSRSRSGCSNVKSARGTGTSSSARVRR